MGGIAGFYYDAENATDLVPMTMWNNQAGGFPDADGDDVLMKRMPSLMMLPSVVISIPTE